MADYPIIKSNIMLSVDIKKLTKIPLVLGILMTMIFGYFCVNTFSHHQMGLGVADNAPSIIHSVESCCSTTFSKYSESLRSDLNLPSRVDDYLLILIISSILIFVTNLYLRNTTNNSFILYKLFLRKNQDLIAPDSFKLAFSNGIINPKVF